MPERKLPISRIAEKVKAVLPFGGNKDRVVRPQEIAVSLELSSVKLGVAVEELPVMSDKPFDEMFVIGVSLRRGI